MVRKYIEKLRPLVLDYFKDDFTGHDIEHLERTLYNAMYICKKEKGSPVVVALSSYLHDIHRIMQNKEGKFVSPKDSIPLVKRMLSKLDLKKQEVDEICYCIEHHEEYNWNHNNVTNINALIVQDADNLDAIGAIGIGRAFAYGGANKLKMYNTNIPLNKNNDYKEDEGDNETTIHHFYHKLFKLGDNMNTKTGKKLANKRIKYMKKFTEKFIQEYNTKY